MIYEAHLVGGPADDEVHLLPRVQPELRILRLAEPIRAMSWEDIDDPLASVPTEEHRYRPVRAVVFYEHSGVTTR